MVCVPQKAIERLTERLYRLVHLDHHAGERVYPARGDRAAVEDLPLCLGDVPVEVLDSPVVIVEGFAQELAQDMPGTLPEPLGFAFYVLPHVLELPHAFAETESDQQAFPQEHTDPTDPGTFLTVGVAHRCKPDDQEVLMTLDRGPGRALDRVLYPRFAQPQLAGYRVDFLFVRLVDGNSRERVGFTTAPKCLFQGFVRNPPTIGVNSGVEDHSKTSQPVRMPMRWDKSPFATAKCIFLQESIQRNAQ